VKGQDQVLGASSQGKKRRPLKRGPKIKLSTPEEERKIFQDKSEPPPNPLVEALRRLDDNDDDSMDAKDCVLAVDGVAAKEDKAPMKSECWDEYSHLGLSDHARAGSWARAARTIRPLIARHWRRLQLQKWIRHVRQRQKGLNPVTETDREGTRECLLRLQGDTFWEWRSGSWPVFWNYPSDQQVTMRDGIILQMKGSVDPWLAPHRLPKDPGDTPKVIEKLCVARDKGHVDLGSVESLISFFEVPKGLSDVRMVYDGTKSGLNEML
jgi:hypothetical protein